KLADKRNILVNFDLCYLSPVYAILYFRVRMSTADTSDFFKEQRTTSEIKSELLNEFFKAWCNAQLGGQRYVANPALAFIDLYAGDGTNEDAKPATPVKILNSLFGSQQKVNLNKTVPTFFNDEKQATAAKLKQNLLQLLY